MHTAAQESCSYYGDVQLVNGSNEREGRVELCIGKVWGIVCNPYFWSCGSACVVCRQLDLKWTREQVHLVILNLHKC